MNIIFIISRSIQVLLSNLIVLGSLPLFKIIKNYSSQSDNIIWINIYGLKYFINSVIWDSSIINALVNNDKTFKIFLGRKIGAIHDKNIFYQPNMYFDPNNFNNYVQNIHSIINQLEMQGNKMFTSSKEVLHWENKKYMHEEFNRLNIPTPKSYIINHINDLSQVSLNYPILLKYVHSYHSKGIYKMESFAETTEFLQGYYKQHPNSTFIAQELINMRKDMRVILVGNEIVVHYWRINPSKEWKPTSTSYTSKVDFISFPEKWREYIIKQFLKLQISTGAFDITFRDDDLDNKPLFLEISSAYYPNPNIDTSNMKHSYGELRRKLWNQYDYLYIKLVFEIMNKRIRLFYDNHLGQKNHG